MKAGIKPATVGCSCGTIDIMKKEAEHLRNMLKGKYGESIEFNYVDVSTEEIKNYPDIEGILGGALYCPI
ncbi:MAG: hypothetical protein WC601_03315 [Desulfotomaculaceae bacterium]